MSRSNLWSHAIPRVELDQRSRQASLRLQQIELLLNPPEGDAFLVQAARLSCQRPERSRRTTMTERYQAPSVFAGCCPG